MGKIEILSTMSKICGVCQKTASFCLADLFNPRHGFYWHFFDRLKRIPSLAIFSLQALN